jgi:hypothetical protein
MLGGNAGRGRPTVAGPKQGRSEETTRRAVELPPFAPCTPTRTRVAASAFPAAMIRIIHTHTLMTDLHTVHNAHYTLRTLRTLRTLYTLYTLYTLWTVAWYVCRICNVVSPLTLIFASVTRTHTLRTVKRAGKAKKNKSRLPPRNKTLSRWLAHCFSFASRL